MANKISPNVLSSVDLEVLLKGAAIGMAVGGLIALFAAPASGHALRQSLRKKWSETTQAIQSRVEVDPMADSLEAGKMAARQVRSEALQKLG